VPKDLDVRSVLHSPRLRLTPLGPQDADELFSLLDDTRLHSFTGGSPLSLEDLRARYAALTSRHSPDGRELWLNWIVRRLEDGAAVGQMEATIAGRTAWVAWVVGSRWQSRGYASEAAITIVEWLFEQPEVEVVTAHIYPGHAASERVAINAGLTVTEDVVDGERVWRRYKRAPGPTQEGGRP
jgi:RimJ/RimL family protein N-acetyltransferase